MEAGHAASQRSILSKRGNFKPARPDMTLQKSLRGSPCQFDEKPCRINTASDDLQTLYECRVYRHEDFVGFIFWGAVSDHSLEFMGVREKREKVYRYEAGLIEDNMLRQVDLFSFC